MTRNVLPYYKAYPRDFIEGTIGMGLELKGAYRVLLDLIYMQSGFLRDDARYISGLLGCSVRKWESIRIQLICAGKIQVSNGKITNSRARLELDSTLTQQKLNAENGAKAHKNKHLLERPLSQPEPEPELKKEDTSVSSKEKPKTRRGSRIKTDWQPSPQDLQHAFKKGLTDDATREQAERFRDHWISKAGADAVKLDWAATWRNWIGNYCDRQAKGRGQRPTPNRQESFSRADFAIQHGQAVESLRDVWGA